MTNLSFSLLKNLRTLTGVLGKLKKDVYMQVAHKLFVADYNHCRKIGAPRIELRTSCVLVQRMNHCTRRRSQPPDQKSSTRRTKTCSAISHESNCKNNKFSNEYWPWMICIYKPFSHLVFFNGILTDIAGPTMICNKTCSGQTRYK